MPRVTITLTEEEFKTLWIYGAHKHVKGPSPVGGFLVEGAFAWIEKYPLKAEKFAALEARYQEERGSSKAVQPQGIDGGKE